MVTGREGESGKLSRTKLSSEARLPVMSILSRGVPKLRNIVCGRLGTRQPLPSPRVEFRRLLKMRRATLG